MKKKIYTLLKGGLFAALFTVSLSGNAECLIDVNPENNPGHCRATSDTFDACFASGEGPMCSATVVIRWE